MSLKVVFLLLGAALAAGVAVGYFLRLIIALGKRGSMELEIKELMVKAQEEAKKILLSAENQAASTLKEARVEIKEKEEAVKKNEDRLIKKEDLLDRRQADVDKQIEEVKTKKSKKKSIRWRKRNGLKLRKLPDCRRKKQRPSYIPPLNESMRTIF